MTSPLVEVDGRRMRVSNLDKILYPHVGFTKGEVLDYYARVAPVLLPHVKDRPLTLKRYPNGVEGKSFFEKDVSRHAPDWVRTVCIETPGSSRGSDKADYALIQDLPTLMWVANLASLELHIPQWTVGPRGARRKPDLLVFDLDPGEPATIVECCEVALRLRDELAEDGIEAHPKTSGSKGMQLYAPVRVRSAERTSEYAKQLAERLEQAMPELVVSRMAKNLRPHKVFIDWSQNNTKKTTVAPYSLRARPSPTVSTPLLWDEVAECETAADLVFTADEVLERVEEYGDLFEPLLAEERPGL
ncbi:ATP-dependent DNA ligase [Prauserella sp. PE36]|uniref:ATP-dependent DNA ligase n=1 Tax=Prauserella endophytica TaxID=1592324 RepID=A0ABY2S3H7_9PSEU|nr:MULTISPECIES: non-homologous end-joining DNA ligase [Prauserella]PXY34187.1 ATP-dependent DNA ligase [Prauserella coralliicola]RBM17977.1 ATP-dependent DNA ligase [Prauserella sp. PE36]TKG70109.1 ATP-dependent DNA ligase [Prauserella endophytica]